jgi:tRNA pseudouridine55 synthase
MTTKSDCSDIESFEGILPVNKPIGKTSFSLVAALRKRIGVKKIGHAGTLDPFASGVLVLLVGKKYTRMSNLFLEQDKEYVAQLMLGVATDTHDLEGQVTFTSDKVPSQNEIENTLKLFQGEIEQIPPMYSAKKINGQKLYHLARKGLTIERAPVKIRVAIELLDYTFPSITLKVSCSKGTYVRSLAHDIGLQLGSAAHLTALQRTRSGHFYIHKCLDGKELESTLFDRDRCSLHLVHDFE